MTRETPYCYSCRGTIRGTMPEHMSTKRHRSALHPRSRPVYGSRNGIVSAYADAYRALRDYGTEYDDVPNSPEWNLAQGRAPERDR